VQAVNITQGGASQGQGYLQPIPAPPGHNWTPRQIVSGFLAANASFATNHAVAREYLAGSASRAWHPGWAVTVFGQNPAVAQVPSAPQLSHTASTTTVVDVTGQVLGNVSDSGQYVISSSTQGTTQERFGLVRSNGEWRISSLPPRLLLTEADFRRVYQPRNLYYFSPGMQALVPYPVYVPQEATPSDLVTRLVSALMNPPSGWLLGAAETGFPSGTKLVNNQVTLDGGTAIVNLGGAATVASLGTLEEMSAQLLWTLAGSSSDQPSIQSVELEVNGSPRTLPNAGSPVQGIGLYSGAVPSAAGHGSFYYTDGRGAVRSLSGTAQANAPQGALAPGQAGSGQPALTSIAVSPDGRYVAGLGTGGSAVYTGALARNGRVAQRITGTFTSLSWDTHDDLWAVGKGGVWLLPARSGPAAEVVNSLPAGDRVTALKIAPDGVRCAMIVTSGAGTQLMIAAVVHNGQQAYIGAPVPISPGNGHFTAVTWYDADHIIALNTASSGPVLDEVAVNGETLQSIPAEQGMVSITADGSSNPLVAGLSGGQMITLASLGGLWSGVVGDGRGPVYPG
jgi:Lipoprotein LpqB beta-propeller domain/Sporulation and spore germination